jgi:hypothetical protein
MRQPKKRLVNALIFDHASLEDAQVCARYKIRAQALFNWDNCHFSANELCSSMGGA